MSVDFAGKTRALQHIPPEVLQASANQTATGTSGVTLASSDFPLDRATALFLECAVTVQGGTSPTLDVDVEASLDQGTTWYQIARFSRYSAATGTKGLLVVINRNVTIAEQLPISGTTIGTGLSVPAQVPWDDRLRVQWVIGGSGGPNFTFAVNCYPFLWG